MTTTPEALAAWLILTADVSDLGRKPDANDKRRLAAAELLRLAALAATTAPASSAVPCVACEGKPASGNAA